MCPLSEVCTAVSQTRVAGTPLPGATPDCGRLHRVAPWDPGAGGGTDIHAIGAGIRIWGGHTLPVAVGNSFDLAIDVAVGSSFDLASDVAVGRAVDVPVAIGIAITDSLRCRAYGDRFAGDRRPEPNARSGNGARGSGSSPRTRR